MPYLDPDARRSLLIRLGQCPRCRQTTYRHYCRQCDEMFFTCGCERSDGDLHAGHRVFIAEGVNEKQHQWNTKDWFNA